MSAMWSLVGWRVVMLSGSGRDVGAVVDEVQTLRFQLVVVLSGRLHMQNVVI